MRRIKLTIGSVTLTAELLDTATAKVMYESLPFHSHTLRWGNEIYFTTPIQMPIERSARDVIQPGELAFWPDGRSIAIAYGPTPASEGGEIRLPTKNNIWARTLDDLSVLDAVQEGDDVLITALEP